MPKHTIFVESFDPHSPTLTLTGDEARHALRVKRLRVGEQVLVLNGAGLEAEAEVEEVGRDLGLRITSSRTVEPLSPALHVWAAMPKGPRSSDLVDALSQVGAASWTPLKTKFATEHATPEKLRRLERVAAESAKQCRRAWTLRIENRAASFDDALRPAPGVRIVMADQSGGRFEWGRGSGAVRLLVGPEGGWSPDEFEKAERARVEMASFGPHVMRIEVAAPTAAAVVLHCSPPRGGAGSTPPSGG